MALGLFTGNETTVLRMTQALYGVAPGYSYYNYFLSYEQTNGQAAFAAALANGFSSTSDSALATTVLANLGLSSFADLQTALTTAFTAYGTAARGQIILNLGNLLATKSGDATYGAAADAFNTRIGNAYTYSIAAANTTPTSVSAVTSGLTFTLSTSADSWTGGTGNDIFNAGLSSGVMTLDAQDVLDGGAGSDVLNVTGTNSLVQASLTGIETIRLTSTAATATLSLLGSTGVTEAASYGSTAAAAFTNISSASVAAGAYNTGTNNNTFTYTNAALTGSTDTAAVVVSNVTGGTLTIQPTSGTNGFETIGITSTGGANTFTLDDGTSTSLTTVNVAGSQDLTLTISPATVTTIGAGSFTGALTVSQVAAATTLNGGSGNDVVTFSIAGADSITAGAGNDSITYTANFDTTDVVNGGDGTDTLTLVSGEAGITTTKVSNIETLKISNALGQSITTANIQAGISTVNLAGGSGTFTVTMEAGDKTVRIGTANTGVLTVADTGTATNDTLAIVSDVAAGSMFGSQNVAVTGYETVTITGTGTGAATTQATGTIALTADTGGTSTLNFVGSNTFTTGAITAKVISASGLTGSAVLTMGTNSVGATTITGSANGDTLYGVSGTGTSIDGGDGKDTIYGGTGNDTLIGGAGNDSLSASSGVDTVSGGAGDDTLVFAGGLSTTDSIDGGDGTDTLSIANASLTTLASAGIGAILTLNGNINNVERWSISDAQNQGANFDLARLDGATYVTLTNGITGNEGYTSVANNSTFVLQKANNATADILSLVGTDVTGTSDSINIILSSTAAGATDFSVVDASGFETITLTSNEATANAAVRVHTIDFTDTSLKTLTVSGTESVDLSGIALYATTVNASGLTAGYIKASSASATANVTMTGSDVGADTLTGGAGDDTITGAGGADSLTGGSGNDSIVAGEGQDTIAGGVGNDTIVISSEVTTAADTIQLAGFATNGTDTITGFDMTNLNDVIAITVADATANNAGGGAGAMGANVWTLSSTAVNGANEVIVMVGATYGNVTLLDAAVDTYAGTAITATNDVTVVYTDGTDAWVVHDANAGTANGASDITVLAKLSGVATTAALATLTAANFVYI